MEGVPANSAIRTGSLSKLKEPNTKEMKSEDVVKAGEQATVLVLVY